MSRTYKATGINLKSIPLGEADRLVTILTKEYGLIRAVAPGARKQKSKLAGSSSLFAVNQLLLAKGKSLDKITQTQTLESYPGFRKDLNKLVASQYLAELVLCLGLSGQPQEELYALLNEHLRRLEQLPCNSGNQSGVFLVLAHLCQALFHLLALSGIAPQVQVCCLTQESIDPDFTDSNWQVGFSIEAGGVVRIAQNQPLIRTNSSRLGTEQNRLVTQQVKNTLANGSQKFDNIRTQPYPRLNNQLNACELTLLQQLASAKFPSLPQLLPDQLGGFYSQQSVNKIWVKVEQILREYTQYHCGRSIRSATLWESLFLPEQ